MSSRALIAAIAAGLWIACGAAHAQSAGEIAFWESVRDSTDPAELRAYLERFPDGAFAPLAQARLARLGQRPAAAPPQVATPAPANITPAQRMPQVGDTWTYRLSYPRLRGQWQDDLLVKRPSGHVVKVSAVDGGKIVDQISVDGAAPKETTHGADSYFVTQGVSVFSPYLIAFRETLSGNVGAISIFDTPCSMQYGCRASGRFIGTEVVTIAGRPFQAIKALIDEDWWPSSGAVTHPVQMGQMRGGRKITVWYVRELRRAVKFSSRSTFGEVPPVDTNWDLELVSYQLK